MVFFFFVSSAYGVRHLRDLILTNDVVSKCSTLPFSALLSTSMGSGVEMGATASGYAMQVRAALANSAHCDSGQA